MIEIFQKRASTESAVNNNGEERDVETYAGDPDHCRMMDDSPNDPGVANAWGSSDARGVHEDRPHRGA